MLFTIDSYDGGFYQCKNDEVYDDMVKIVSTITRPLTKMFNMKVGNSTNALGRLSFGRIEELKRQRPFLR